MKSLLTFFVFSLLAVVSCEHSEKENNSPVVTDQIPSLNFNISAQTFKEKFLKNSFDSLFAETHFNGVISLERDGRKLYEKFQGFRDFREKDSLEHSAVFAIASLSKQFTAALILKLEDEKKLNTDEPLSKYLDNFHTPPFTKITIAQLLNHTSGLSDSGNGLLHKPGAEFRYSNKGYRYLGDLITKLSGKSFDQNVMELFQSAGMKNSSTAALYKGETLAGAWSGTWKNAEKIPDMPRRLAAPEISVPAGGILSTVADLHRWNVVLHGGGFLSPNALRKMQSRTSARDHPIFGQMHYGFGLMMNRGKPDVFFHSGYVKGAPSLLIYYPKTKTSVVVLSNIANENLGKSAIFNTHKKVKALTDLLETAWVE